jgi:hypothetical protein
VIVPKGREKILGQTWNFHRNQPAPPLFYAPILLDKIFDKNMAGVQFLRKAKIGRPQKMATQCRLNLV